LNYFVYLHFPEKNYGANAFESSMFPTDTQTTQTLPTTRPQIPIAKPNFPRVAVPFVIAMWVFGTCIIKISKHNRPELTSIKHIFKKSLFYTTCFFMFH
jgi:hypothetical protein